MAIGKIVSLAVAGPGKLELEWDDGHGAAVDLGEIIAAHSGLKPLRAAKAFAKAALSEDGWSVEWPGGVDFGSPQLRRWADEQAGETMRADDFRAWMEAHALTLDSAASALGLSRRMIAYYASGEKVVPKTVLLATRGWQSQRRESKKASVREAGSSRSFVVRDAGRAVIAGTNRSSSILSRDSETGEFIPVKKARSRRSGTNIESMPKSGRDDKKRK